MMVNINTPSVFLLKMPIKNLFLKKMDIMSWSWGASNPSSMFTGASDIVVTKGVTLPNGQVIKVGDCLVLTANGFIIVSPRDAASGLPTGK